MNKILDIIYPRKKKCLICGAYGKTLLCEACASAIRFINGRMCLKCGKSLADKYSDNICPDCLEAFHYYDIAFSCFEYEGLGKELIHLFKYKGFRELSSVFANYLAERILDEMIAADYIVPVPIHYTKLQKRGFNQSKLICEDLSKLIRVPIAECIKRVKDTERQYNLDKAARIYNIFDAFSPDLSYNIYNKDVILIDDIYTTGSTVNECSRLLKDMGAKHVYVFTAAAGKNT